MIKIAVYPSKPWRSGANILKLIVNRKSLIVIFVFFLFTIIYSLFTSFVAPRPVYAVPSPSPGPAECQAPADATAQQLIDTLNKCAIKKNVFDDKVFNLNQIAGTIDSLNTHILGLSLLHPETNNLTAGRGALATTSNLVAGLYGKPPASGVQYFAQEIQKFNPVQPAYAQGLGYQALTPVKTLWGAFRNASYLGFVIIFVIMGFMIMFRAHISPQAVATVQDSLPRIVVALILVTFSYAIAGLMIDIMFLGLNVIIRLLADSGVIALDKASEIAFQQSIFGVIVGAWGQIFTTTAEALHDLIDSVLNFGGDIFGIISWGVGGIAGLVVGIAALFIMFRVFLMLLMAYVMVILLTLVAPFFFLFQALPGNTGAKEWFKQMAANLSVFPAVAIMIIFAGAIGGVEAFGAKCDPTTGVCAASLGGQATEALKFPLLVGGLDSGAIGKIIAIGVLLMTPEAAKMIKEAIGAKGIGGGAGAGAAIGGALGAGAGVLGAGGRHLGASPFGRAVRDIGEAKSRGFTQGIINRTPFRKTTTGGTEARGRLAQ